VKKNKVTIDGNEAAAYIAYQLNEVCAIYPITPSSTMGELCDEWASQKKPNLWGVIPTVVEMQSEGGAAGALHGSLQTGAITTTFTASQGLLLMIPNMFKIAGELTSTVFHVSARSIAAQASAFESRIPFMHFFDGFRTSHEIMKIEELTTDDMKQMMDEELILAHRKRALSPENPFIRGTAQNPDVYFQARETVNSYYNACPEIVQKQMNKLADLTGRSYQLFEYHGHKEAERIIVIIGSGAETVQETSDYLNEHDEKNV